MKLVYVSGAFRASSRHCPGHQDMFAVQENIMAAMKIGLEVARTPGMFPIIPHANSMFFTGSASDDVWLAGDLEILIRCDAVIMVPGWEKSFGASEEYDEAIKKEIPVFLTIEHLRSWGKM